MDNRDYFRKSEVNYASKFKNESGDAPKVIRAGAQQSARPGYPSPAPAPAPEYYAYRDPSRADANTQLMVLQSEISRLREEISRQNQRNELREEIARLKEELRDRDRERRSSPSVSSEAELSAAERELGSLIAELKREPEPFREPEEPKEDVRGFAEFAKAAPAEEPEKSAEPSADYGELMEKLDSVKADFAEKLRAETDGLLARLKETGAGGESIIDTPSIMQSTLLDEIMDLKRALDENSVTKDYLNESVDRILEQFKSFLGEAEDRKQENDREREQYVATQFSLLYEMLAFNFETNSELIEESKESIEEKIKSLDAGIGRNSSAAAELVIKLTQIISLLGIELKKGQDVVAEVRKQLDARFERNEREILAEIENLNVRLANLKSFESAADGVDMLVSMGFDKLAELLKEKKAKKIFTLKQWKDSLHAKKSIDIVLLANYIKEKALLLGDYDLLVADVESLKRIVKNGVESPVSADLMEGILELPLDMLLDFNYLTKHFTVDRQELSYDSEKILERIGSLQRELTNLKQNHQTLFEGIAGSIREISAAVDNGARAEDLERINERMEKALPEMLAVLQSRIVEGIKDNVLDKNETKVRLENLSFELSKLTEFSEISSILYDFKREVEDAIEGNIHEFGGQVKKDVEHLAGKVESSLENNEIAVEVAKLAQNVAVSPNFDQTMVLEEIEKLKKEVSALREALSPSELRVPSDLPSEAAAFSENK